MGNFFQNKIRLFDLKDNTQHRDYVVSSFSERVPIKHKMHFLEVINYVIDNTDVFDREELEGSFYDGEDETLDLVLPAVMRVFHKVYIDPPPIFKNSTYDDGIRLELFQLNFDIDEFNQYLIDMLIKSSGVLKDFENLDRAAETISLVVDNYVGGLVKSVLDSYDIKGEIVRRKRDKKLKDLTR